MCYKKVSLQNAYDNGLRRCPCCNVQLVWKASLPQVQANLATVDHIVPNSIGGSDTPDNMFVMCRKCNEKRATDCFVAFVTERGISKTLAEELYHKAHVVSLQNMIFVQFTQPMQDRKTAVKINKKKRKQIRQIIQNYVDYFGDYLPEFQLLQKLMHI